MQSFYIRIFSLFLSISFSVCAFAQPEENLKLIDEIVGVVGNEIVLRSQMESQKLEMMRQGLTESPEMECLIMEQLLVQRLYIHQARLDSLVVSEDDVSFQLERRLQYYVDQFGSIEALEEFYGKTISQLKEEFYRPMKEEIMVEMLQGQVARTVNLTPEDVQIYFNKIDPDSLPLVESEVQYSQIVVDPEITDEDKKKTEMFLDSIRTMVVSGSLTMSVAAARHSDDPGSKFNGGCYDLIRRGSFVPEYEAAVYNTEEGGFSPVFESDFGFHFVYVDEKRGELYKSCHVLKQPQIRSEAYIEARAKLDTIITTIRPDSLTFERAAVKHSTDKESANQQGKVINPMTGSSKHLVVDLNHDIFFALDELEPGEFSDVMEFEKADGSKAYRIIRLDARINAHKANMKEDYQMLRGMAEGEARQLKMNEWIDQRLVKTFKSINETYTDCPFQFDWVSE